MKKLVAGVLVTSMMASLVACGGSGAETKTETKAEAKTETEAAKAEEAAGTDGEPLKVGLILGTGGLGDKNFNDMAYAGITRAQEELGIEFDYVEPAAVSDYVPFGMQFAETEEYDLIITMGADQLEATKEIRSEFPDQNVSLIDAPEDVEGVSCIQTRWTEQTFLTGVMAGLGTKGAMDKANEENVIGVILGMDNPVIHEGITGFTAGAKYVNPDVEVLEGTVGSFTDPGKGKEMALSMYNKGADYIQCIAGASGLGIFGAAKEADKYAFGVGQNQNAEDPDHIPASAVRDVSAMVYNECKAMLDGTWEAGLHVSGIKEGAVGCDTTGSNVKLTEEAEKIYQEIKAKVESGELAICKDGTELEAWLAENQYN